MAAGIGAVRQLLFILLLIIATPTAAQTFPPLSGRVVDQANLLSPEQEAELTGKLEALERASSRQLVVATVPDLQGYEIRDYGYQLGRRWGIGQRAANNGVILLVAPNERRVAIEVGYGLEPVVTDALSHQIVQGQILPRFRAGDHPGGITAGVDALIQQLQAPPEVAEQRALAANRRQGSQRESDSGSFFPLLFWLIILFFVIIPLLRSGFRGRKYRGRRRGFGGPIVIWGPGWGGGWGGGSSRGWGGGGWGGGFGGGGFSGGGGSFGGGGASGGW